MRWTDLHAHGLLVHILKNAIQEIDGHLVKWARRSANSVAHNLAKEGCVLELSKTWFPVFLDCTKAALDFDSYSVY